MSEDAHETPQPTAAATTKQPEPPMCPVCSRYKSAYNGHQACQCLGIQPYAMSTYPGEHRLVKAHPSNQNSPAEGQHYYKAEDVQKLLDERRAFAVRVAQAEYEYWRQFMDHEHPEKCENAIGACGAAANIVGGIIRQEIKPKDDKPIENVAALQRRLWASESVLMSGAMQYMINQLREKVDAHGFLAAMAKDGDREAVGEHAAYTKTIELLDEFEAHLNTVLLLLPDPTR